MSPASIMAEVAEATVPDETPVPPGDPCPLDTFPPLWRDYIKEGTRVTAGHPCFIIPHTLVAVAAAIGNRRGLAITDNWREWAIIRAAVSANSGSAKTASQEFGMHPLWVLQHRWFAEHKEAMRQFDQEQAEYERARDAWSKSKGGLPPPTPPTRPLCRQAIFQDTTTEGIVPALAGNGGSGVIAVDELAKFVKELNQYRSRGGGDTEFYLSAFNNGSVTINRKSAGEPLVHAGRVGLSITGGTQPSVLREIFSEQNRENGFLARFLIHSPPDQRKPYPATCSDARIVDAMTVAVGALADLHCDVDPVTMRDAPIFVRLSPEAETEFRAFYERHQDRIGELAEGHLRYHLCKLEGYVGRFALLFHCFRQVTDGVSDPFHIDPGVMRDAIRLGEWYARKAEDVYAMMEEGAEHQEVREVANFLRRRRDHRGNARTLYSARRWRKTPPDRCEELLAGVVAAGLGEWEPRPTTVVGRPTEHRYVRVF